jgi:hypothetical protein
MRPRTCLDAFGKGKTSYPYQDSNSGSYSPTQCQGRQLFNVTPAVFVYKKDNEPGSLLFRGYFIRISAVLPAILAVSWWSPSVLPRIFLGNTSVMSRLLPSLSFLAHSPITLQQRWTNSGYQIARVTKSLYRGA